MLCKLAASFAFGVAALQAGAVFAQPQPPTLELSPTHQQLQLPSTETTEAIGKLPQIGFETWAKHALPAHEWVVTEDQWTGASTGDNANLPFVVPNSMIIQSKGDVSAAEIEDYLADKDLPVIQTFPSIGAVQVEADVSSFFSPQLSDTSANDALLRGMVAASEAFRTDDRIQSATPDFVLTDKKMDAHEPSYTNMLHPTEIVTSFAAGAPV